MTAAGVCEAHGQAHIGEVILYPFDLIGLQVDIEGMTHSTDQLARKSAGLAEVIRFRRVGSTGNDNILDRVVVI